MASNITKNNLIDQISERTEMDRDKTKATVDAMLELIAENLETEAKKSADERSKIQLIGFGSFEVRDRSARTGRNPQTGKEMQIPAKTIPAFKAGKSLKDTVNVK